jgi:hypothetical protein
MRNKKPLSKAARNQLSADAQTAPSGGLLIAVELGAQWPLITAEAGARRVLAQLEGELPGAFADRVGQCLDGLFGRGVPLTTLALACNERTDPSVEDARRKLAGLALGSMAKHKSGRVLLTASPRSSGRLRHALSALAQGLFEEWRTAGLQVSVDFGDEAQATAASAPFVYTARVA